MHTNTEHHPAVIRQKKIVDPQNRAMGATVPLPSPATHMPDRDEETDSGSETEQESPKTVTRPKGESTEERRTRKAGIKAERQVALATSFL